MGARKRCAQRLRSWIHIGDIAAGDERVDRAIQATKSNFTGTNTSGRHMMHMSNNARPCASL